MRNCGRAPRNRPGGYRCQDVALTGDAERTGPACVLAPSHAVMRVTVSEIETARDFVYRNFANVAKATHPTEHVICSRTATQATDHNTGDAAYP